MKDLKLEHDYQKNLNRLLRGSTVILCTKMTSNVLLLGIWLFLG